MFYIDDMKSFQKPRFFQPKMIPKIKFLLKNFSATRSMQFWHQSRKMFARPPKKLRSASEKHSLFPFIPRKMSRKLLFCKLRMQIWQQRLILFAKVWKVFRWRSKNSREQTLCQKKNCLQYVLWTSKTQIWQQFWKLFVKSQKNFPLNCKKTMNIWFLCKNVFLRHIDCSLYNCLLYLSINLSCYARSPTKV